MSQPSSMPPQDDFALALLRSAEGDEPSNAAYAKAAAALGVSTAVGVGASLPAPAALLAGSSGLGRWLSSLSGKLAVLGVSGALLVGAGGVLLRHQFAAGQASARGRSGAAVSKPAIAVLPAAPGGARAPSGSGVAGAPLLGNAPGAALAPNEAAPAGVASTGVALGSEAAPASSSDGSAVRPGPRPARAGARAFASSGATRASTSPTSSLPEQVQSLDRARVALGSGDAGAALVEIAHYRKAWRNGVFLTEASVLEIEALAKRGERSLAASRAQAFVTAHPDSPQAERLRTLIPAPAREQP